MAVVKLFSIEDVFELVREVGSDTVDRIELDYGAWDGRPVRDIPADLWANWRGDPTFVPPGGESPSSGRD